MNDCDNLAACFGDNVASTHYSVTVATETTCPAQTLAIPASAATPNLSNPDAIAVDAIKRHGGEVDHRLHSAAGLAQRLEIANIGLDDFIVALAGQRLDIEQPEGESER